METVTREYSTDFTQGTISGRITITGDGMEDREGMVDRIFSHFSKMVTTELIPHFNRAAKLQPLPDGKTKVEEQMKIVLFGLDVVLKVKADLNIEFDGVGKDAIRFLVMESLAPEVASAATEHISKRLKDDTVQEQVKEQFKERFGGDIPLEGIGLGLGFGGRGGLGSFFFGGGDVPRAL